MNELVQEFLVASSFIQNMETTLTKQLELVRELGIDKAESIMLEFFEQHKGEIVREAATSVVTAFTEEELKQLIEFYRTPLGQMLTSKMPMVGAQMNMLLATWLQRAQSDLEIRLFENEVSRY